MKRLVFEEKILQLLRNSLKVSCKSYSWSPAALKYKNTKIYEGNGQEKATNLIFAHANGFHKELWEPVISRVLEYSPDTAVGEIIAFDSIQHGDSAILNRELLSLAMNDGYEWSENSHDILNLLNLLELYKRPTIGVGHSFGAVSMMISEILHPGTFKAIIAVDPAITLPEQPLPDNHPLYAQTLRRKNGWKNKEDFKKYFTSKIPYAGWSYDHVELYKEYGLFNVNSALENIDHENALFKLKCDPVHEHAVYRGTNSASKMLFSYRAEIKCPVYVLYGEHSYLMSKKKTEIFLSGIKNGISIQIKNTGHLLTMQDPESLAENISKIIQI